MSKGSINLGFYSHGFDKHFYKLAKFEDNNLV